MPDAQETAAAGAGEVERLRKRVEALEAAAREVLQVQDGLPMTGIEASRRADKLRALLLEARHD